MNYQENERQWERGDFVIHDADRKSPKMLMEVVGFTRAGRVKTRYVSLKLPRKVYDNPMAVLHEPERFGIKSYWGNYSVTAFEQVIRQWDEGYWQKQN